MSQISPSARCDLVKGITIGVLMIMSLLNQLGHGLKECFIPYLIRQEVQSLKTRCDIARRKKVDLEKD